MPTAAPAAAPTPIPIALPELYPPGGAVYPPVPPEPPVPPPPPYWADAAAHTARQSVVIPVNRTIQRESIVFPSVSLGGDQSQELTRRRFSPLGLPTVLRRPEN